MRCLQYCEKFDEFWIYDDDNVTHTCMPVVLFADLFLCKYWVRKWWNACNVSQWGKSLA